MTTGCGKRAITTPTVTADAVESCTSRCWPHRPSRGASAEPAIPARVSTVIATPSRSASFGPITTITPNVIPAVAKFTAVAQTMNTTMKRDRITYRTPAATSWRSVERVGRLPPRSRRTQRIISSEA
ncbi:MAG: hypothetical protein ACXWYP_01705, partial [Pseudonocardia sp.]